MATYRLYCEPLWYPTTVARTLRFGLGHAMRAVVEETRLARDLPCETLVDRTRNVKRTARKLVSIRRERAC